MRSAIVLLALTLACTTTNAQETEGKKKNEKGMTVSYGSGGLTVKDNKHAKNPDAALSVEFANMDIGINILQDNTNYSSAAAKNFVQVPPDLQNSNLFDLRTAKSVNVNLWPVMARIKILAGKSQKIYASTGIGLQVYNFRYSKGIRYVNNPLPGIYWDSLNNLKKNKLTITYLSVPLQFTFKTKLEKKLWLVYGAGVTGGFRISSYNKSVSPAYGKQKDHGNFDLNDFNSCVTAEFGLDHYFRLYASYQLTNMYKDASGLDQHPFSIGLRLGGI